MVTVLAGFCPACGRDHDIVAMGAESVTLTCGVVLSDDLVDLTRHRPDTGDTCEWDTTCSGAGVQVVGELVVCASCAPKVRRVLATEGNGFGQVLCSCGYWKPKGTACGEPCL